MVKLTVVFAGAVLGVILRMAGCGVGEIVIVGGDGEVEVAVITVATGTVADGVGGVLVGGGVRVTTVAVGEIGVDVNVAEGVSVAEVGDGIGEAVGVITTGLPNSLQPRSGAAPMNPVMG